MASENNTTNKATGESEYYSTVTCDERHAYSTVDLVATLIPPPQLAKKFGKHIKLGTLQMLSVSMHRDKFPVSACAKVGPRGFTCGHRTIAGTLSFATFDREVFSNLTEAIRKAYGKEGYLHADELFTFDILIVAVNDYGCAIYSYVKGVTLLDEGVTYSLDDIVMTENYSYMALDRTPWQKYNKSTTITDDASLEEVDDSDPRTNTGSYVYVTKPSWT